MRKNIFLLMALSAIMLLSACTVELESVIDEEINQEEAFELPANVPAFITASLVDTKTAYDEDGKFSWTTGVGTGDRIYLMFYKDDTHMQGWVEYEAQSVDGTGKAVFNIVSGQGTKISTDLSGYTNSGVAVYGKGSGNHVARPNNGYSTEAYTLYEPGGSHTESNHPFLTLQSSLTGASSEVVLIGTGTGDADPSTGTFTDYHFYTACAVLKVTVTGVPAEASALRLYTSDKVNYPLNGDFAITAIKNGGTPELASTSYRQYKSSETYWDSSSDFISAAVSGTSSQSFYFNVPTGTYPANTLSIKLVDDSGNPLLEKKITSDFTFHRNDLVSASFANEWTTLGTGAFYDKGYDGSVWNYYHAEVIVQQNSIDGNKYRLIDPYGAYKTKNGISNSYTSDSYLEFEIVDAVNDYVSFEDHSTGLVINEHNMVIRYPSEEKKLPGNAVDITHNKVLSKDGSGNPLIVQLAPLYKYEDANNGWTRYTEDNRVIIFFPGYERSVSLSTDSTPTDETLHIMLSCANAASAKAGCARWASDAFNALSDAFAPATGYTFSGFSGNGLYTRQIAVVAYNSNGLEIFRDYFERIIYTISAANETAMAGTYWIQNGSSYSLTVTASDDVFKGNLMVTSYPAWSLTGKIYGCYDGSKMKIDDCQVFNQHGNGNYYGLHNPNTTEVGELSFTVSEVEGKKRWAIGAIGIGIATVSNGVATSYTSTSHKWTSSPVIYQQ